MTFRLAHCVMETICRWQQIFDQLRRGEPNGILPLTRASATKIFLIGQGARKIKDIGSFARKELEVAMNKKVFLDLDVLVDEDWMERLR